MKFLLLLIVMANIALAQPPEIEDFVLKGYETSNFKNVLLDPDSPISDFYLITDDGNVIKVKNMGLDPEVQNVYTFDGDITEALSNEDTHYLSLAGSSETMLIATKNFIDIDTIYFESNAKITDFQIDNNTIYILTNKGSEGKILYSPIGTKNWSEKATPDVTYNRIFVMDTLVVIFKYLDEKSNFYFSSIVNENWLLNDYWKDAYYQISEISNFENKIALYGRTKSLFNYIYFLSSLFEYFGGTGSAVGNALMLDAGYENDFRINYNTEFMQVGYYLDECECSYIHKFIYNGDGKNNRYLFPNSKSLNKIKSNKRSKNIQFVSVGDDGLILLINRSSTSVEKETEYTMDETAFTYYPNPIKEGNELKIESEELINSISVTDITGKIGVHYMMINKYEYNLPISGFAKGVYFLTVNGKTQKIMIE